MLMLLEQSVEVLRSKGYDQACDWWSLGVIMVRRCDLRNPHGRLRISFAV